MSARRIRVMVVEDRAAGGRLVASPLARHPTVEIVVEQSDARLVVRFAKLLRPDVVTIDLLMPDLDVLGVIAELMAEVPTRILAVCRGSSPRELELGIRAISAGALEVVAPPRSHSPDVLAAWGRALVSSVELMSEIPVVRRREMPAHGSSGPVGPRSPIQALALVASTGGPAALAQILSKLPGDLPVPIFIAQHMTEGFTQGMLKWFGSVSALDVRMAIENEVPLPGTVYVPPDGHDLLVLPRRTLGVRRRHGGPCPCADELLTSMASAYGASSAAFVLTGMGEDGAKGARAIREASGATFAQDERSSTVWGMPGAAWGQGAIEALVPLAEIPARILELLRRSPQGQLARSLS